MADVHARGENRYLARGCGRSADYVCVVHGYGDNTCFPRPHAVVTQDPAPQD